MDIACPECAAAYEIDAATIGPAGRKVRCAACGSVWRVAAPSDMQPPAVEAGPAEADLRLQEPETVEAPEIAPEAIAPPPETAPAPVKTRWIKDAATKAGRPAAWRGIANWRVAAVAATILLLAGALHQRERVVRHLPQTAKLYAAIGLPVNLRGIEIRGVSSRVISEGEETVLVVEGELANVSDRRVDVPRLHFTLLGPGGRQVYVWSAQADRAVLQPGENLAFRRRLAAPPTEAKDVSVRFLTRSDITAGIK